MSKVWYRGGKLKNKVAKPQFLFAIFRGITIFRNNVAKFSCYQFPLQENSSTKQCAYIRAIFSIKLHSKLSVYVKEIHQTIGVIISL